MGIFLLYDFSLCIRVLNVVRSQTGERAQRLRVPAALAKGLNSIPMTQVRWLTTACHYSSRGSDT